MLGFASSSAAGCGPGDLLAVNEYGGAAAPQQGCAGRSEVSRERGRLALVVLLAAIYALCFVAIKSGLPFAPPLYFAALRALLGGLTLLLLLAALRQSLLPARASWGWVLGLALTTTTLAFGAMFLSPGRTGAGIASVLGNLQPVLLVALAAAFLGERLTRGKQLALALGAVGVLLISSAAFAGPDAYGLPGALLALTASGSLAVGSVLAARMGEQPRLLALTAWQLLLGGVPLLVASALLERDAPVSWSPAFVGLVLFLAVAGTALPTPIWYWLLRGGDVGRLGLGLYLVPAFGLAVAAAVFGERIGLAEGLGIALTLAGTAAAMWESHRGGGGDDRNHLDPGQRYSSSIPDAFVAREPVRTRLGAGLPHHPFRRASAGPQECGRRWRV